jgi:hypothetical protein
VVLCLCGRLLSQRARNSPPQDGTITGVASPCIGTPADHPKLSVTVYLTHGARELSDQKVKGTYTYRFVVHTGSDVVDTHEGGASKPVLVTVHSGPTVRADIPSVCR